MSLALIQGYSSPEEEEEEEIHPQESLEDYETSSDNDDGSAGAVPRRSISYRSVLDPSNPPPSASALPSAFDAFSEIAGPPQFLNNLVDEDAAAAARDATGNQHGRWKNRRDKKDLPAGAVVEVKAQLVGIHERVRSDIETNQPPATSVSKAQEEGKRVPTATNPNAEDAAELLRMCLQCGIPKTYSSQRGMVCPVCGDRPPSDPSAESKKKGSTIKEKEKNKRMKGQSSHAAWKSETEMQLRQQFD